MIETNNYIDLSILPNQNIVMNTLTGFLSKDQLEALDLDEVVDNYKEDVDEGTILELLFENCYVKIMRSKDFTTIPPIAHISIEFARNGNFTANIKCQSNRNNPTYFANILAKAINRSLYGDKDDYDIGRYDRKIVMDNLTNHIVDATTNITDIDDIIGLRGCIATNMYNNEAYLHTPNYDFNYVINNSSLELKLCCANIVKFSYSINNNTGYMYFPNTDVGINMILLVLDKAVVKLKDKYYR